MLIIVKCNPMSIILISAKAQIDLQLYIDLSCSVNPWFLFLIYIHPFSSHLFFSLLVYYVQILIVFSYKVTSTIQHLSAKFYCSKVLFDPNRDLHVWRHNLTCIISTHWGRDKMAAIFQTAFSNASFLIKINKFRLRTQWSLCPRVQSKILQHWFR